MTKRFDLIDEVTMTKIRPGRGLLTGGVSIEIFEVDYDRSILVNIKTLPDVGESTTWLWSSDLRNMADNLNQIADAIDNMEAK